MTTRNDRTMKRQRRKRNRWIAFFVFIILIAGGSYYYFNFAQAAQAQPEEPALQTAKVRTGDIVISLNGIGEILPQNELAVGFETNGIIKDLFVSVGEVVEEGQILAQIDDTNAALQLEEALLNWEVLTSPQAVSIAERNIFLTKDSVELSEENLKYLISPSVYHWENELDLLSTEYQTLKNDAGTDQEILNIKQAEIDLAQANLNQALSLYQTVYLPENFSFTYTDLTTGELAVDPVTGELLLNIVPPTQNEISLAWATLRDDLLKYQEAQVYLAILTGEDISQFDQSLTYGSSIAQLEQAQLAIESAQLALDQTTLKSPISGTVTSINVREGQSSGTNPIIEIKTIDQMMLSFYLEESALPFLSSGKRIIARFDAYPDIEINGEILNIDPSLVIKDGELVIHGWASLNIPEDIQLLSLMSAEIEVIAAETYETLIVPVQAIRELAPGSYSVFVVGENEQLEMRIVTIGIKDFANAEILTGLNKGDVVSTGTIETGQ